MWKATRGRTSKLAKETGFQHEPYKMHKKSIFVYVCACVYSYTGVHMPASVYPH